MNRNFAALIAASLIFTGCSNQTLQQAVLQRVLNESSPQQASAQFSRFAPLLQAGQGPALDVRIASTNVRGGFLRESKRGNIESWLGNDGISLIFDRGVLHGTRGLGAGLLASDVGPSASAILAGRSGEVERLHTFLNGNDQAITRAYACAIRNDGTETIQVDNRATSTSRMTETCRNINQEFTNTYWVDRRRGQIVQSRQWSGEFLGQLEIRTVYDF